MIVTALRLAATTVPLGLATAALAAVILLEVLGLDVGRALAPWLNGQGSSAAAETAAVARPEPRRTIFIGANQRVPPAPASYGYGINFGWRAGWDNRGLATIAAQAGATTARIKLPEWLLAEHGDDIEHRNGHMAAYAQLGLRDLTAFLIGPIPAHSTAPPGADRDHYAPKNLYEPIWLAPGRVNPDNYWAAYVHRAVSTYKGQVRIWEIWNEPDFVNDWDITQRDWWQRPPEAKELPFWNDSVFAYIRLLRVSYEVIKAVDPDALVATGGLGYESFLDALLRYTDNPADGSATPAYPATGGAYFDALSYHHYPEYAIQDLATGTWHRQTDSDAAADALRLKRHNLERQLVAAGYDGRLYPEKHWLNTETGFASKPIGRSAGGMDLMANYLAKHAVLAQVDGLLQVHWYVLTDQEPRGASTKSHDHMGLYYDVQGLRFGQHEPKPAAAAYATTSRLLAGHRYDAAATAALALPPTARGYVFSTDDGRRTTVLWARTANSQETASAEVALPVAGEATVHHPTWTADAGRTVSPADRRLTLLLTGTPVFVVEPGG